MKAQPVRRGHPGFAGIEIITQDDMADLLEVHSKLVASAGSWFQLDSGDREVWVGIDAGERVVQISHFAAAGDLPACLAGLAVDMIDHLARRVVQVLADGKVDLAAVLLRMTGHQGVIGLLGLAILELAAQLSVSLGIECHHDHTTGVAIESMDDPRSGMGGGDPAGEAVGLLGADPRNREETGGLVQNDQTIVLMQDGGRLRHGIRRWEA